MRFPPRTLEGIAAGKIDRAFRRWDRPMVRAGATQLTAIGLIGFGRVEAIAREEVTDDEARRAGFESGEQLLAFLERRASGDVYRVMLRVMGPDPRVALREEVPDERELDRLCSRLERLDRASSHGAWTQQALELIEAHPERRAGDLAEMVGRERLPFKVDVRKLKQLGLTESLPIGYRLSPRGGAVLDHMRKGACRAASREVR